MSEGPPFLDALADADPEFGEQYAALYADSAGDGALSAKTKTLMTMALDAAAGDAEATAQLADKARAQGASEAEVAETVELVAMIAGMQGLSAAAGALESD